MDNIGPTSSLDGLVCALLQVRNTPDPDCGASPAEILYGRPILDAFGFINRQKNLNPSLRPMWGETWALN